MSKDLTAFEESIARHQPRLAMVLGSGLSNLLDDLHIHDQLSFEQIPDLPTASVKDHPGKIILAHWIEVPVLIALGRLHYYEGLSWKKVEEVVRQFSRWGIDELILTNAAGGIRPELVPGELMLLTGHLELLHGGDWKAFNVERAIYQTSLSFDVKERANQCGVSLHEGTYLCMTGPSYETPAEIRAFREWGAHAVGMSTTREARAASEEGMNLAAISFITNQAAGLLESPLSHDEVLEASRLQGSFRDLLRKVVKSRGERI